MEAPSSSDYKFSHLYAIAKLGRTPEISKAQLINHPSGYIISKPSSGLKNVVDINTVKEAIQQLPTYMREGKVNAAFYNDLQKGLAKLELGHSAENDAIQFIAQQTFFRNRGALVDEKPATSNEEKPITSEEYIPIHEKPLQDIPSKPLQPTPNPTSEYKKRSALESIAAKNSISVPKKLSPLQKEAFTELKKLISPIHQNRVMDSLRNLSFIETKEDLSVFKEYIQSLVKLKSENILHITKGKEISREIHDDAGAKAGQAMLHLIFGDSKKYTDEQQQYLLKQIDSSLIEQAALKNTQIIADIFVSAVEPTATSTRRDNVITGLKAQLDNQLMREARKFNPEFGDFTADEKKLVSNGFIKRAVGFDVWEKAEWLPGSIETVPLEENKQIFISGIIELSVAVPGNKPFSGRVELDLKNLGNLTYEENLAVMHYLNDAIFESKREPAYPPQLEVLRLRPTAQQGARLVGEDGSLNLPTMNAKEELLRIAAEKRKEFNTLIAKTYFQATHPDIKL